MGRRGSQYGDRFGFYLAFPIQTPRSLIVEIAGSTGVGFVGPHEDLILPAGAIFMGEPDDEVRRYAGPRQRNLGHEQERAIRAAARGSSFRDLAAEYGVSHQTVARILREHDAPGYGLGPGSGGPPATLSD